MSEVHLIILASADMDHTDDSVTIDADCGHSCWIAPSGLSMVLDVGVATTTTCLHCVNPAALRGKELREVPGSREEVVRDLGEEKARRLWNLVFGG